MSKATDKVAEVPRIIVNAEGVDMNQSDRELLDDCKIYTKAAPNMVWVKRLHEDPPKPCERCAVPRAEDDTALGSIIACTHCGSFYRLYGHRTGPFEIQYSLWEMVEPDRPFQIREGGTDSLTVEWTTVMRPHNFLWHHCEKRAVSLER